MYRTIVADETRLPLLTKYSKDDLIGRRVRVISNASYKHYKKFGRIVGFTKNEVARETYIYVYFDETKCKTIFAQGSLELIN